MSTKHLLGITYVTDPNCEPNVLYVDQLRHADQGGPRERITFYVINGGWRGSIYKDGRYYCQQHLIGHGAIIRHYKEGAKDGYYQDVICDWIKSGYK